MALPACRQKQGTGFGTITTHAWQRFLSPQTMAQRWREDVYRQLMHKGMATEQRPAKPGFADYLFCLLSKVPDVETHYAKELALLESIIQHPEKYQNNPTIIQHWLESPIH